VSYKVGDIVCVSSASSIRFKIKEIDDQGRYYTECVGSSESGVFSRGQTPDFDKKVLEYNTRLYTELKVKGRRGW
jgi:hypothetical protein